MFYSINGKLLLKNTNFIVVDCSGIGFKLFASLNTISRLPEKGSDIFLYTHLHTREDILDLFGFIDESELNSFKLLISVSGVGPKAALAVLSAMTPDKFALAVAAGDVKSIRQAPGIGPKIAQRIILELKDKITSDDISASFSSSISGMGASPANSAEAVNALMVLGYNQTEAASAISRLDDSNSVEELIKQALKILSKQ